MAASRNPARPGRVERHQVHPARVYQPPNAHLRGPADRPVRRRELVGQIGQLGADDRGAAQAGEPGRRAEIRGEPFVRPGGSEGQVPYPLLGHGRDPGQALVGPAALALRRAGVVQRAKQRMSEAHPVVGDLQHARGLSRVEPVLRGVIVAGGGQDQADRGMPGRGRHQQRHVPPVPRESGQPPPDQRLERLGYRKRRPAPRRPPAAPSAAASSSAKYGLPPEASHSATTSGQLSGVRPCRAAWPPGHRD